MLDKETHEPISGVVVYTNSGNKMTMTDDIGCYSLNVYSSEPVSFRNLAYDLFETTPDVLLNNPTVYLNLNVIELSEVVVSPDYAHNMLNKAVQNLLTRLQTKKIRQYIVHSDETTNKEGKREVYALSDISLSKASKRGAFHWNIQLNQLDQLPMMNEDQFYIKKAAIGVDILPTGMIVNRNKNDYIYEIKDTNEYQIIIKTSPLHLNKKNWMYRLYTIDIRDTVLIEAVLQSYSNASELTKQKFRGVNWQTTNYYGKTKFMQDEKTRLYYLAEDINLTNAKVSSEFAYDVSFKETVSVVEDVPVNPTNNIKKKIKPYSYFLFESKFPNSPGFWEKYIKP